MPPRPLVAGNWKMNGRKAGLAEVTTICERRAEAGAAELALCPPATLIAMALWAAKGAIAIGGQDCHPGKDGAHTGDISAEMLADLGAAYVIVGHSERRADHGETSAQVRAKADAAWRAGIAAIVCVGETRDERNGGKTLAVVGAQLQDSVPDGAGADKLVIAYEPVWAIGTGLTPTVDDVEEVHTFIRDALVKRFGPTGADVRVLYGGSVKPANAAELLTVPNVDGALVGGASLKADDFLGIAKVYASRA